MTDALHQTLYSRPVRGIKRQLRDLVEYDDARASAPHEHSIALLGAAGLALCALRAPTRAGAVCHAMIAGVLLFRAASGRDGLRKWVGARPAGGTLFDADVPSCLSAHYEPGRR